MSYWAPIPGFGAEFEVSRDGKVRNVITGKHLVACPSRSRQNRLKISLYRYGKRHSLWVHRLVLMAHVGPPPFAGAEGDHLDFNTQNNSVENLAWSSHRDNVMRATMAGRRAKKLTAEEVRQIRDSKMKGGNNTNSIAEVFGVSVRTIQKILKRDSWGWLKC